MISLPSSPFVILQLEIVSQKTTFVIKVRESFIPELDEDSGTAIVERTIQL